MIFRGIDIDGDWNFGKGRNDYLRGKKALMVNLKTRLQSFLGDCFFDLAAGIDWFNLLGSRDQLSLKLAITATILNTPDVTGVQVLNVILNPRTRAYTITYRVATVYGPISDDFIFDLAI
jgi:hypothetical protein